MPRERKKKQQNKKGGEEVSPPPKQDSGYGFARSCADADARTHTAEDAFYAEAGQEHWHP